MIIGGCPLHNFLICQLRKVFNEFLISFMIGWTVQSEILFGSFTVCNVVSESHAITNFLNMFFIGFTDSYEYICSFSMVWIQAGDKSGLNKNWEYSSNLHMAAVVLPELLTATSNVKVRCSLGMALHL